jgi:hypothetical protein
MTFANAGPRSILIVMAVNWLEVAKKMAEDARAQLALNRRVPHPFALFAKGWERCRSRQPFSYADDATIVLWPTT